MFGRGFFRSRVFLGLACVAWLVAVGSGFVVLQRYETTPGVASAPTVSWPKDTIIPLEPDRLTLVLTLHPRCPCSAATISQLEQSLPPRTGRFQLNVLLYKPAKEPDDWTSTSTSAALDQIAGAKAWIDVEGAEAARFGATTSGQLSIYDSTGRLRFQGGITPGRGASGASEGNEAVAAILDEALTELKQTPVYGCSLLAAPSRILGESQCPSEQKIALPRTAL